GKFTISRVVSKTPEKYGIRIHAREGTEAGTRSASNPFATKQAIRTFTTLDIVPPDHAKSILQDMTDSVAECVRRINPHAPFYIAECDLPRKAYLGAVTSGLNRMKVGSWNK
ncbi:hypothetical protein ADUPG1_010411, partial [Aduncisulcus paluster]